MTAVRAAIKADPQAAKNPRAIGQAAGAAFLPALQLLHKHGADLNAVWRNYRPLHNLMQSEPHAASAKPEPERLACLDWLLEHGANPELTGAWPPARAIIIAAFVGEPEFVKRLRKAGSRVDGFAGAALGDCKLVEKALRERPDFGRERDAGGLTALQCAAGSRLPKVKVVEAAMLLLDAGADPNAKTRSWAHDVDAAYFAAGAKNGAMFELLLERGADATGALSHAVWGKHFALAELALAHGAEPDRATANGKPLLNDLIRWGQIPQTTWLLARGASPNIPDDDGWTAVHQAASRGNARMLRAVLDAGGDMSVGDKQNCTPLEVARFRRREKLAAMMSA
ncbi:MAG TPA: ankyrin repeat domain-containing protein [Bryobacteraceae bacterium]|nr:ankyrin repeat domain-containing protein [Bryobacteraceae bacterium]